jgi:hypothetical protein
MKVVNMKREDEIDKRYKDKSEVYKCERGATDSDSP